MSLSVAPYAERKESHGSTQTVVTPAAVADMATEAITQHHGRCSLLYVLRVAKTQKYRLNPVVIDQSTVQIVTARRVLQGITSH
jgi:hypothetical protein